MRKLLFFSLSLWTLQLSAQSDADARKAFPNADAAFTNLSCEVAIKLENGVPSATSTFKEDMIYLSDNSVRMMNRGWIYHSSFHELTKWDAYVQNEGSRKMKYANAVTKNSTQDYIFYDDAKSTSFDFTGAAVGATRHMEYELVNKDGHMLSPFYFERYFPVVNGELRIVFPEDISVKYVLKGNNKDKISFTEQKKRGKTIYLFKLTNIEGVQHYADAPDNAYYATHVVFYIDKINQNGQWVNYLSSPDDLYKTYQSYVKGLNKSIGSGLKTLVDSITVNTTSPREKAEKIYKWVQSNIKYVAFEEGLEGFVPREADLVFNRRFGDCKDMASILSAMLNYAKVPAHLTWIGTRDIPYSYSELPLPLVDNHMICSFETGNETIYLDGTDSHCVFGKTPYALQGKEALIGISETEYKIKSIPVAEKAQNQFIDSTQLELTDNNLTGKLKVKMNGYYAMSFIANMDYRNKEEKEEFLKSKLSRGNNKIKFSNWQFTPSVDNNSAEVTADFELKDYARKVGDEWIINLNLFKWYEHQEIDFPKRKMPIEFNYLNHTSFVTTLKLPLNSTVSFLPKSEEFNNDIWGFKMKYSADKNIVSLSQEFDNDHLMLQPQQFEQWNKVLEHLFPHYKQTVVLSIK